MRKERKQYQGNSNFRLQHKKDTLKLASLAFVCKEHHYQKRKHKLSQVTDGPYRVTQVDYSPVVLRFVEEKERVYHDRVVEAAPLLSVFEQQIVSSYSLEETNDTTFTGN